MENKQVIVIYCKSLILYLYSLLKIISLSGPLSGKERGNKGKGREWRNAGKEQEEGDGGRQRRERTLTLTLRGL